MQSIAEPKLDGKKDKTFKLVEWKRDPLGFKKRKFFIWHGLGFIKTVIVFTGWTRRLLSPFVLSFVPTETLVSPIEVLHNETRPISPIACILWSFFFNTFTLHSFKKIWLLPGEPFHETRFFSIFQLPRWKNWAFTWNKPRLVAPLNLYELSSKLWLER